MKQYRSRIKIRLKAQNITFHASKFYRISNIPKGRFFFALAFCLLKCCNA